jgi:hypothetical protein
VFGGWEGGKGGRGGRLGASWYIEEAEIGVKTKQIYDVTARYDCSSFVRQCANVDPHTIMSVNIN